MGRSRFPTVLAEPEVPASGIDRRDFVRGLAAAGAGGVLAAILGPGRGVARAAGEPSDVFPDGVMSGDPLPFVGTIWTRLARPADGRPVPVMWMVAEDDQFQKVMRGGIVQAEDEADYTLHVRVDGLRPDRWYRYCFYAEGCVGPVGRLRTSPRRYDRPDRLRYAFASCQQRNDSYYVAHRAIAREGVDFLMHLGDYVYVSDFGTITLEDYRRVYRRFHDDPLLQEMQAAVPMVATWDDGEFYNGVDRTGDPARLAAAKRAWFEYFPQQPQPRTLDRLYRRLRWGTLADVLLLDTRSYRDPEVPANAQVGFLEGQDSTFPPGDQMFAEGRTTLGGRQKRWLEKMLQYSNTDWRMLGSSYNVTPWKIFDYDTPELREMNPDLMRNGGIYVSNEAWDDYQAERRELLEFMLERGVDNVVFTCGHTHFYLASELMPDFDDPASPTAAFDFTTGSLTADPDPRTLAPEPLLRAAETSFERVNEPYMKDINLVDQGYAVVDLTPEECIVSFRVVDTFDPDAEARTASRYRVVSGSRTLEILPPED